MSQASTPLGTVLITGGCGFLGSHIVSHFLARYQSPSTSVHVLDLRINQNTREGATYHQADLTSSTDVRSLLQKIKPAVIVHTASPVAVGNDSSSSQRKKAEALFYKVNVEGTRTLLAEAREAGVRCFVYTSSASVISDTKTDLVNADESYELVRSPVQLEYYSDTKAEAESAVLLNNTPYPTTYSKSFLTTSLRPSAVFGEGDVQMIPNMLNVVRTGRTGFQLGDNDNLFDFTYAGNIAHAHALAAERLVETHADIQARARKGGQVSRSADEEAAKVDGEAFIITNASPVYFWDFARAVWTAYSAASGAAYPPVRAAAATTRLPFALAITLATLASWTAWLLGAGAPRLSPPQVRYSCMTRYFKPDKALRRLGYVPAVPLDEAVRRTVEWFWQREQQERAKKGQ